MHFMGFICNIIKLIANLCLLACRTFKRDSPADGNCFYKASYLLQNAMLYYDNNVNQHAMKIGDILFSDKGYPRSRKKIMDTYEYNHYAHLIWRMKMNSSNH